MVARHRPSAEINTTTHQAATIANADVLPVRLMVWRRTTNSMMTATTGRSRPFAIWAVRIVATGLPSRKIAASAPSKTVAMAILRKPFSETQLISAIKQQEDFSIR